MRTKSLAVALAACILGGCADPPPPSLAGKWVVTLRAGRLPLAIPTGAPAAEATLTMATDTASVGRCTFGGEPPCAEGAEQVVDAAVGTFELRAGKGFRHVHASGEAHLAVTADGMLHLTLGPCCDAGAISGSGAAREMRGTWHQEFLSHVPGGRYRITPLADRPPAAPR